jgi:hypothetical protein
MSLLQQFIVAFLLVTVFGACKSKKYGSEEGYILVKEQGSFAVGGTVVTSLTP